MQHNKHPDSQLISLLIQSGYHEIKKVICTLQGSIWRAYHISSKQHVVIKVANKFLSSQSATLTNGKLQNIQENILSESKILQHLTMQQAPKTDFVTKYIGFYSINSDYLLLMQDGGVCVFDFCVAAHHLIKCGKLDIVEWHKMCKTIFKQMLHCIEYIHSQNVCHFDISLENFLIRGVDVMAKENGQIQFVKNNARVLLCDFGVAQLFAPKSDFITTKYCGKDNYKSPEIVQKKPFSAKYNDYWGLGVVLFSLVVGCGPFTKACRSDERFCRIMDGKIVTLLKEWGKIQYVDQNILDLLGSIFKHEAKRTDLCSMLKCRWLNTNK